MDTSNPICPWEADDKATLEASSYMGLRFNARDVRIGKGRVFGKVEVVEIGAGCKLKLIIYPLCLSI